MSFNAIHRLGDVLGSLSCAAMLKLVAIAVKQARVPVERRAELLADFRKNDPRWTRDSIRAYLTYLGRYHSPATRLCHAGVPAWVVHADKGDGGLTDQETAHPPGMPPYISVITIPGTSYFIPNEEPEKVAELVIEALDRT